MFNEDDLIDHIMNIIGDKENLPQGNPRCVIYTRQSKFDAGRDDMPSTKVQMEKAQDFILQHIPNGEVVAVLEDIDKTGRNSRRKGLRTLMRLIREQKVDVVVVWSVDRFYRNAVSFTNVLWKLDQKGVRIITVAEGLDSGKRWMKVLFLLFSYMAEMVSVRISQDIRARKEQRFRQGSHNGQLPFGYCNGLCVSCNDPNGEGYCPHYGKSNVLGNGKVPVPHPVDKYGVQLIFALYANPQEAMKDLPKDADLSTYDIADLLNRFSFRLPTGEKVKFRTRATQGTRQFQASTVRGILKNPFYLGLVKRLPERPLDMSDDPFHPEKGKTKYPKNSKKPVALKRGKHEPIISPILFEKVQSKMRGKGKTSSGSAKKSTPYLLTGIARCAVCWQYGHRKSGLRGARQGRSKKAYYRCGLLWESYKGRRSKSEIGLLLQAIGNMDIPSVAEESYALTEWAKAHHNVPADKAEEQVLRLLQGLVFPEEWQSKIALYFADPDEGIGAWISQKKKVERQIRALRAAFKAGMLSQYLLKDKEEELRLELVSLDPRRNQAFQKVAAYLANVESLWNIMDIYQRRQFLRLLFHALYFDAEGNLVQADINPPFDQWIQWPVED